jgi:hypothetical protein
MVPDRLIDRRCKVTVTLSRSAVGMAAAMLAAVCFAGQPSEAPTDRDRASEQRTGPAVRENSPPVHLEAAQLQALRNACPGRVDLTACVAWHLQPPGGAGEIVGTSSTDQGTLKAGGLDVSVFGRR